MRRKILIGVAIALAITAVVGALRMLERAPDGVREVVWNKESCSHCHMHVGVPEYAAQLHTKDGEVHNFDDPGCLFEWVTANGPRIKATYFHHYRRDAWLNHEEVGFVEVEDDTPMGFGIGAVARVEHPEAMSFGEASAKVLGATEGRMEKGARPSARRHGHGTGH